MKISVEKELGIKKEFEVATSNINVERAFQMQLDLAKRDDISEKTGLEILQLSLDTMRKSVDYIKKTLKLNKTQCALVDEMETSDTAMLVNRICMRLMGNTDEEIEAIFNSTEETSPEDLEKA